MGGNPQLSIFPRGLESSLPYTEPASPMEKLLEYLQTYFPRLDRQELEVLAQGMVEKSLTKYTHLIRAGDPSNSFFVIKSGLVGLYQGDVPMNITMSTSSVLSNREFFFQESHSLTARAESDITYWEMTEEAFMVVLQNYPQIGIKMGDGEANSENLQMTRYLQNRLARVEQLSSLDHDLHIRMAQAFTPLSLRNGDSLYQAGQSSQGLYFVDQSALVRTRAGEADQPIPQNSLLGVDTLLNDGTHQFSVEARSPSLCWMLSRSSFSQLDSAHPVIRRALSQQMPRSGYAAPQAQFSPLPQHRAMLEDIPELATLSTRTRGQLLERAIPQSLAPGDTAYEADQPSASFFLVLTGEIELSTSSSTGVNQEIRRVEAGGWFGLDTMLSGQSRNQKATATQDTELLELRRDALEHLARSNGDQWPPRSHPQTDVPPPPATQGDLGDVNMFRAGVFHGLSVLEVARITPNLKPVQFMPPTTIYNQGDSLGKLYLLQEGIVQIDRDGSTQTLHPGTPLGIQYVMRDRPSGEYAFASSEVHLLSIACSQLYALANAMPKFNENLWAEVNAAEKRWAGDSAPVTAPPSSTPPPPEPEPQLQPPPVDATPPTVPPEPSQAQPPTPIIPETEPVQPPVAPPAYGTGGGEPPSPELPPPPQPAVSPMQSPPSTVPMDARPPVVGNDPFLITDPDPVSSGKPLGQMGPGGWVRASLTAIALLWLIIAGILWVLAETVGFSIPIPGVL